MCTTECVEMVRVRKDTSYMAYRYIHIYAYICLSCARITYMIERDYVGFAAL